MVGVTGSVETNKDGFVTRLSGTGQELGAAQTFGGLSDEEVWGVAADSAGNIYIGGSTTSRDFPLKKAFDPNIEQPPDPDPQEGFVVMFPAAGSRQLGWSSFVGGEDFDAVYGLNIRLGGGSSWPGRRSGAPICSPALPYDGTRDHRRMGSSRPWTSSISLPPREATVYDRPQEDTIHMDIPTPTSTTSLLGELGSLHGRRRPSKGMSVPSGQLQGSMNVSPFTLNALR